MAVKTITIFDADSTSNISQIICVIEKACFQVQAYNLGPGETVSFESVMIEPGQFGSGGNSCCEIPPNQAPQQLGSGSYSPCGQQLVVSDTRNMVVVRTPGCYRMILSPAALGTAIVTAMLMDDEDSCEAAASACCCEPEVPWLGSSLNPFLTITPGGPLGHSPVFDYDLCGELNSLTSNPNPVLTDEMVFMSGGACFRTTIDNLFSAVVLCDSLGELAVLPPAAGDQVVGLDVGGGCKRMDGETFVEFFETPWTGISTTPALTITPGGVNDHGPTFNYDLCADIQAQASCACEPDPGDQILIVQGGACVLATWPTVDVCDQVQALVASGGPPNPGDEILVVAGGACLRATWPTVDLCDQLGLLPNGALIAGDTVLVREAGGACKQVLATAFGGGVAFPLLAPDGSCLAPSYSFTSDPTSGMFYSLLNTSVVVSNNNCEDFIEIGNSVDLNAATSFIRLRGGYLAPGAACGIIVETNAIERLRIGSNGAWNLNTLGGGNAGDVITSFGSGTPPQWVAPGATPILAADGSCAAPSYSFTSSPDSGMFYDPAGVGSVIIGDDNCVDSIAVGASIAITTNSVLRHTYTSAGAWNIGGSEGVLGQAIVSNGPGVAPTWQTPSGVAEPITQIVYGTGPAVDSSPFFFYNIATGAFSLNENLGPTRLSLAAPGDVNIAAATNTASVGRSVTVAAGNSTADHGGQIFINGGDTSESVFLNRTGGNVTIRGGQPAGGFQHGGGDILIHGGNASVSSQFGGTVRINYGTEGVTATQNSGAIYLGRSGGGGGDGGLNIPASPGGLTTLRGTNGRPWSTTGSILVLQGGEASNAGPASNGGDVRILTGQEQNGGVKGRIDFFADQGAFDSPIAHFTAFGDMVMGGYGQGTNGTQDTALLATATTGFLWPPRIAGAPTGVPAGTNIPGGTVYANPMVVRETGGTIVLSIYEFGAAAWRSVTLT
jgi:hypothetical protein